MNRKPLLALSGISIVAIFSLAFLASTQEGSPAIIPGVTAATNKSFTFDSAVGTQYWDLDHKQQSVATGQGSPIVSWIELTYEKNCERGFGGGSLFYYQNSGNNRSFNFWFGVNNIQGFEFAFHTWNSGWNMQFAEFHAVIDYQDYGGSSVYLENYDLVNGSEVNEDSPLHANTPITYSWNRTQELVGEAIRKVSVNVSYSSMSRIFMDYITVSWSC
ncbi:MAG: hypothetical protein II721_07960 [Bacilli bacterium]|nr:hypothetical protein [Bacilli bacterium]